MVGENLAEVVKNALYADTETKDLSEEEKNHIVSLSSLAAGLAGSLVGNGDLGDGATAAAGGQNAVENNSLTSKDIMSFIEKYEDAESEQVKEELVLALQELDYIQQQGALEPQPSMAEQQKQLSQLRDLLLSPDCNSTCQELVNYSFIIRTGTNSQ